jgi:predicted outer membrane repeat protein
VSSAAKQSPHRPDQRPALGLRAWRDGIFILSQTGSGKETTMWLPSILGFGRSASGRSRHPQAPATSRRSLRLDLEQLEDRTLPSNYVAASVPDLIADINAANAVGGSNTITLAKKTSFVLSQANNTSDGSPTGLPVIAAGNNLTVLGNNGTIERSSASGTPTFRLFDLASGASLTLENLTLQNGDANAGGGYGGAIYSNGALTLSGVSDTERRHRPT